MHRFCASGDEVRLRRLRASHCIARDGKNHPSSQARRKTCITWAMCGALDFSKVDDVCGRLETREVLLKKAAHDARCAHRGPGAQPRVADESIGGLFSRLRGA